jgi:tRNA A58 N-methylase Trm61
VRIAWALAETGGKLTTVELDPERHRTAVANFKEAGLTPYMTRDSVTLTRSCRHFPDPSTSCSRTLTRSGTTSSLCGPR